MTGIFESEGVTQYTGYEAFVKTIPMMLYPIAALLFVFAVAWFGFNLGSMRRHERRAIEDGELYDASHGDVPGETGQNLPTREDGRVSDLIVPVLTLIGVTVAGALYLGISRTEGALTALKVMENTDVILALFYGGLAACAVAGARLLLRRTPPAQVGRATLVGLRSMITAVMIVFLAWVTAEIIAELGIGEYVAGILDGTLPFALLPVLLFLIASFISFSMGSTFGTFGLLLPVTAEIVVATDPGLLLPAFGAVLAGAIFGDHTSPLSDTTILSSIGSGIQLIDHTTTQLPYAAVCAVAAALGYVALGLTQMAWLGLAVTLLALGLAIVALRATAAGETPAFGPTRFVRETRERQPGRT
jgi:tetracycline resistance efflux pump